MGDIDPDLLLFCKDGTREDWTRYGGATLEGSTARGTTELAQDVLLLDAQAEGAYVTINPVGAGKLPLGAYVARIRVRDTAQVANDLRFRVLNQTDASDILAWTTKTVPGATFAIVEILFTLRTADSGDEVRIYIEKATAGVNTIRVDYLGLQPAAARFAAYGNVPPGASKKFTLNASGDVTAHTIYDKTDGTGNVIESAVYTYSGSDLTSIAYTRDGKTATQSFVYSGGNLDYISWSI